MPKISKQRSSYTSIHYPILTYSSIGNPHKKEENRFSLFFQLHSFILYRSFFFQTADEASRSSPSPQKGRKMTIIEKNPPPVQVPSPGKSRPSLINRLEGRRDSRSPEPKDKRRDSDLLSTATSALRRLHFRSAGGSRSKRGK